VDSAGVERKGKGSNLSGKGKIERISPPNNGKRGGRTNARGKALHRLRREMLDVFRVKRNFEGEGETRKVLMGVRIIAEGAWRPFSVRELARAQRSYY